MSYQLLAANFVQKYLRRMVKNIRDWVGGGWWRVCRGQVSGGDLAHWPCLGQDQGAATTTPGEIKMMSRVSLFTDQLSIPMLWEGILSKWH